jgi:perosamine synthetase
MLMAEKFVVPKDPRLSFGMLLPRARSSDLPSPVHGRPTHYVFWARNAIYHGLQALGIESGDNVLVPSFHCTSVVEPILKYGAAVKFYEIDKTLQPNIAHVEAQINARTRAILAIHYFGFPQAIQALKDFSRRHNLFLIEDCAHVLTGRTQEGVPLGSVGDISVFSWRKFFPLYDGGQLVINNPELKVAIPWDKDDWFFSLKVAKNILDKVIDDSDSKLIQKIGRVSRWPSRFARRLACTNGHSPKAFAVNSYDLDFDLSSANLGMSSLSKYILHNTNIAEVIAKRRNNYTRLLGAIKSFPGITPLYQALPQDICPWVFPVLVGEKGFHLILRKEGIPAFTWGGVIHPTLPLSRFPNSSFLYDNLVFLPIHQSIGKQGMETMVGILQRALDS